MKDYMMIFFGPDFATLGYSPEQMQENMEKWFAWMGQMQAAGIYKGGEALTPHIRHVTGNDRTVTDRAGSEVKELIGGYVIVSAKDMDEVVEIAQGFPDYDIGGTVEIREVMVFDQ